MNGRQQVYQEMLPITRHLMDARRNNNDTFAIFVAPNIHDDAKRYIRWIKEDEKVDINAYTINEFVEMIKDVEYLCPSLAV